MEQHISAFLGNNLMETAAVTEAIAPPAQAIVLLKPMALSFDR
jgi:hypothetical protein